MFAMLANGVHRYEPLSFTCNASASSSNTTSYSFSSIGIGAAYEDRVLVVFAAVNDDGAGSPTITSITADGVSMFIDGSSSAGNSISYRAIGSLYYPTGTTVNIVVTCSPTCERAGISTAVLQDTWGMKPIRAATAASSGVSLATHKNATGIFGSFNNANVAESWTNATEMHDLALEATTRLHAARGDYIGPVATNTISMTGPYFISANIWE